MGRFQIILCLFFSFIAEVAFCQTNRIADKNHLGWFVYEGDHPISEKWQIHTEYQWRRIDFIKSWQQSLARLGVAYQISPQIKLGGGYTAFITFPYGEYPTADTGEPFPERRLHQDVQLSDTIGKVLLQHRFRLEQRWIGQLQENTGKDVQSWEYQNRIRYQIALTVPLQGRTLDSQEWYLNFFDELFIGFGKNVGQNIFNQNRISGGLGYQFTDDFQLELNYLYQITQHGASDPVSGNGIFEYNQGFRLGVVYNLNFLKNE
ncbi:DUF2490 domain-containing protein [Adhaeribacter pallidiroseus]|uniref:DUF2490 domain-containing protein n=1 Tax=Adhaeribacter pallidiroseus TaxID=2072847 RepID=A0A369QHF1_9BACT|nr:DUF2490 domain-containing protein [Adhaeribacter pallidiroseus]RDC61718.1 hypothetical protein AHMF7616_00300 [Adhaeribacter pallidiroseus]